MEFFRFLPKKNKCWVSTKDWNNWLILTKVENQYVFTIIHKDEYGDRQVAILDFDNKEFIFPIKEALLDITEI